MRIPNLYYNPIAMAFKFIENVLILNNLMSKGFF